MDLIDLQEIWAEENDAAQFDRLTEIHSDKCGVKAMTRRDEIIKDCETLHKIECDVNFDPEELCDGDTCRNAECDCWHYFKVAVESHLEEPLEKKRLCGSMSVWDVVQTLRDTPDFEAPVFVNGQPINEMWWDGDGYQITSKQVSA